MDFVFVYITCPDTDVATQLARGSVQARLAACANIMPGMTSVYEWNGSLQTEQETVLILKTRSSLADALTEWVSSRHPYTVPCILQIPVSAGNELYLSWLSDQTGDRKDD
jgi:periplasmic divalent cation tolerance protein